MISSVCFQVLEKVVVLSPIPFFVLHPFLPLKFPYLPSGNTVGVCVLDCVLCVTPSSFSVKGCLSKNLFSM